MSDYTHDNLTLVGRHVPETPDGGFANMQEAQAAGHDTLNPVTGMYEIGVVIDGAFVPIFADKASLVFDRIDLAKRQAAQQQAQQAQQQAQGQQQNMGKNWQQTAGQNPTQ